MKPGELPAERTLRVASGSLSLACTDTGTGPAVVLLHAGGERRGVWSPVAARLASAGYRSFAIDQRAHGDTGGEGKRLSEFVERQVVGAGHLVARDRPEELAEVLLDLLSFLPSGGWRTGA